MGDRIRLVREFRLEHFIFQVQNYIVQTDFNKEESRFVFPVFNPIKAILIDINRA